MRSGLEKVSKSAAKHGSEPRRVQKNRSRYCADAKRFLGLCHKYHRLRTPSEAQSVQVTAEAQSVGRIHVQNTNSRSTDVGAVVYDEVLVPRQLARVEEGRARFGGGTIPVRFEPLSKLQ